MGMWLYLMDMEKYIEFIEENFTPRVTEDKDGMKVILTSKSEVVPDSVVWFERAKKGWNRKPLSTKNTFIITNVDMVPLLDFMDKYMGLSEDDYSPLRVAITHYSMEIIDKHLNGGK